MALFTDSGLINITDLVAYESTLSKLAATHNVDIEAKTTVTLAAIGDRLMATLMSSGAATSGFTNTGLRGYVTHPPEEVRPLALDNVVGTDRLKRWICYEVLAQIFSEAYNVQLNDRFKAKWTDYAKRAQETANAYLALGIGVVSHPLPKPAQAYVSASAGNIAAGLFTVQCTWSDAESNESTPSEALPVTLGGGSSITVSIVPSNASIPRAATGWNVYVGEQGGVPMRQNSTPVGLGASWTATEGFANGKPAGKGQAPDYFVLNPQRVLRG